MNQQILPNTFMSPKAYTPNDKWMYKAKREGFRARSVYKLAELDQRFGLFKEGTRILDIGAAPGSWLQYISQKIGDSGMGLGLDIQPIRPISGNIKTKVCDINNMGDVNKAIEDIGVENFDAIVSDIAPNTTGISYVDQAKSVELSRQVLDIAREYLKPRGFLVMKVFRGEEFDKFIKELKGYFRNVSAVTVSASRDRSREIYVVCK